MLNDFDFSVKEVNGTDTPKDVDTLHDDVTSYVADKRLFNTNLAPGLKRTKVLVIDSWALPENTPVTWTLLLSDRPSLEVTVTMNAYVTSTGIALAAIVRMPDEVSTPLNRPHSEPKRENDATVHVHYHSRDKRNGGKMSSQLHNTDKQYS